MIQSVRSHCLRRRRLPCCPTCVKSILIIIFPLDEIHEAYRATRKEYQQKLRNFLNQTEEGKIKKQCISVEPMKSYSGNSLNPSDHHPK